MTVRVDDGLLADLEAKAQRAHPSGPTFSADRLEFRIAASPDVVLALVAKLREARELLRLWVDRECAHTYPVESCVPCADRDRAEAFLGESRRLLPARPASSVLQGEEKG